MQQHECFVDFKARFYTLGHLSADTKQIWFVLHGYGQLARYFVRKFNAVVGHDVYVIAPEGLSTFYLDRLESSGRASNRVGATWMTRENRTADIDNYVRYLDTVYAQQTGAYRDIPVTVVGFSQGAATASRWVMGRKVNFSRLILWSGIFPPDMDFEAGKATFKNRDTFFVCGTSDPYITDSRRTEMEMISTALGVVPQIISFEGAHEIDEKTLLGFL